MTIGVSFAPLATTVRAGDAAVLSESRVKGLVGLVCQVDGYGSSRDALGLPASAPRGYSSPEHGSSGPVSRRGVDEPRVLGNSLEQKTSHLLRSSRLDRECREDGVNE